MDNQTKDTGLPRMITTDEMNQFEEKGSAKQTPVGAKSSPIFEVMFNDKPRYYRWNEEINVYEHLDLGGYKYDWSIR